MLIRNSLDSDTIIYNVKAGDSLHRIIKTYHGSISLQQQNDIVSKIMTDNPEIKNPNLIYSGQILIIDIPQQYTAMPGFIRAPIISADETIISTLKSDIQRSTPPEKDLITSLAPILLGTGATGLTMIDRTFKSNTSLLTEMVENYNDYKADKISKGQYDYRRKKLVNRIKAKLGPTNALLNGNRSPNEVLRISRKKVSVPTQVMTRQIGRMGRVARLASKGGAVLSIVGLGVACHDIANTDDKQRKNEILVESLGGVTGGLLYGAAVTTSIIIIATPVGWLAGLVIGVGGILASYTGSEIAKSMYDIYGNNVDLISETGVKSICKQWP